MKVEITVEKTIRIAKEVRVTQTEFESLRNGESPFALGLVDEGDFTGCYEEIDFCVNGTDGKTIVDWR